MTALLLAGLLLGLGLVAGLAFVGWLAAHSRVEREGHVSPGWLRRHRGER